jgi:hypothetical protein
MSIREENGPLEAVLRAAAAPAHQAELAGEQEAVAAFLAAEPAPRRRSLLARILTVKALVIGGVAASTGVVLATASGVLPAPWPERPSGPAADPPAVTTTTSLPAVTPPAGSPSAESEPADQDATPPPSNAPPCDDHCVDGGAGHEPDQPHDESGRNDNPGKGDKPDRDRNSTPPTSTTTTTAPSSGPRSPGSSASGAETAVPPNGATPPTKGG